MSIHVPPRRGLLSSGAPTWVPQANGTPAPIAMDAANQRMYVLGRIARPEDFLTVTRASTGYRINPAGTYESIAANLLRYTYNPTTLAATGVLIEEARTNSIRNNSMQGASAGAARSIASITAIARAASATAVIACGTHNVVANDMVTVSGATPASYNGTFLVASVVANTSISYVTSTNTTDSASGFAVSAIGQGTAPTNWNITGAAIGLARSIVGVGTENGIDYVDVRFAGLTSGTSISGCNPETSTQIVASNAQVWAQSLFITLVGGSMGDAVIKTRISERDSGGLALTSHDGANFAPAAGNLRSARQLLVATNTNASTAFIQPQSIFTVSNATVYDFTLRIGWPQEELGASVTSPIRTTNATVTRNGDNVSMALPTALQNLSEYTLFSTAQPTNPVAYGGNTFPAAISDTTSANRLATRRNAITGFSGGIVTAASVAQYDQVGAAAWNQDAVGKVVQAGGANNNRSCFNGTLNVATQANTSFPAAITNLFIGANGVAVNGLFGGAIAQVALWSFRVPNNELQRLTT